MKRNHASSVSEGRPTDRACGPPARHEISLGTLDVERVLARACEDAVCGSEGLVAEATLVPKVVVRRGCEAWPRTLVRRQGLRLAHDAAPTARVFATRGTSSIAAELVT